MGGSAGGGSSSPELPGYIEDVHRNLLVGSNPATIKLNDINSVIAHLQSDLAASPYFSYPRNYDSERGSMAQFYEQYLKPHLDEDPNIPDLLNKSISDIKNGLVDGVRHTLEGEVDRMFDTVEDGVMKLAKTTVDKYSLSTQVLSNVQGVVSGTKERVKSSVIGIMKDFLDEIPSPNQQNSMDSASNIIDEAISKVIDFQRRIVTNISDSITSLLNNQVIRGMVDAYADSISLKYNQAMGNLSSEAGMAGAVRSSSYTMAMAFVEMERQRMVSEFEAKLKLEFAQQALRIGETGQQAMASFTEVFRSVYGVQLEEFRAKLGSYMQALAYIVQGYFDYIRVELGQLYGANTQLTNSLMRSYYAFYISRMEQKNKDVLLYLQMLVEGKYKKIDVNTVIGKYLFDVNQFSLTAKRDFYLLEFDREKYGAFYEYDLYQKAANVLAASSGAVVNAQHVTQGHVSPIQGAMSGAAMGAQAGLAMGGTHGAVLGGVIGGLGGLAASLFD